MNYKASNMKVIQTSVKDLGRVDYYIKHLGIINPFLPVELTPKEREVLGTFMSFTGDLAQEDRFGTTFRKEVKRLLNLSDGGIGNHLSSLKRKGAIAETLGGILTVKEYLFPEESQQFYQFKILQKDE